MKWFHCNIFLSFNTVIGLYAHRHHESVFKVRVAQRKSHAFAINRRRSDSTGVILTPPYPVQMISLEAPCTRAGLQWISGFSPMTQPRKSEGKIPIGRLTGAQIRALTYANNLRAGNSVHRWTKRPQITAANTLRLARSNGDALNPGGSRHTRGDWHYGKGGNVSASEAHFEYLPQL